MLLSQQISEFDLRCAQCVWAVINENGIYVCKTFQSITVLWMLSIWFLTVVNLSMCTLFRKCSMFCLSSNFINVYRNFGDVFATTHEYAFFFLNSSWGHLYQSLLLVVPASCGSVFSIHSSCLQNQYGEIVDRMAEGNLGSIDPLRILWTG